MELTTRSKTEEPLFKRTHLILDARFEASVPSRGVVAQRISEAHDVPISRIVIRSITGRFGGALATVDAYLYADEAKLHELESAHLAKRTAKTAPKAPEPAQQAPAAEEAAADTE